MQKPLLWNKLKSRRLKKVRDLSFEELIKKEFIGIEQHPTRPNQKIMLFHYKGHVWAAPYVEAENHRFLKTLYPSGKYTRIYKGKVSGS